MARTLRPVVFADANVLYAAALRDILIELALAGTIRLHWSAEVLEEVERALCRNRPDLDPRRLKRLFAAMNDVLPDAEVVPQPLKSLTARLPDPDDAHVLAGALAGGCSHILTFNLADFPAKELAKDGDIVAVHPDAFLLEVLTTEAAPFLNAVVTVQRSLTKPELPMPEFLDRLTRLGLSQTAALLRALLAA